jgi:2-C-methyl-D-erythritol 4-phosphate cytidylyltransferase
MKRAESEKSESQPIGDEVSALILAGGMGLRMGGQPKALLEAGGETLLERAVRQARDHAAQVIVGLPEELVDEGMRILGDLAIVTRGGATRQLTFRTALARSSGGIVVVHDVARPFASGGLWAAVVEGARQHGAAAPALALQTRDSLALDDEGWLGPSVDRERVVSIQTPYAFRSSVLDRAVAAADGAGWDETSVTTLVTRSGQRVFLVPGEADNSKVTFEEDWDDAKRRITAGHGAPTRAAKSSTREL